MQFRHSRVSVLSQGAGKEGRGGPMLLQVASFAHVAPLNEVRLSRAAVLRNVARGQGARAATASTASAAAAAAASTASAAAAATGAAFATVSLGSSLGNATAAYGPPRPWVRHSVVFVRKSVG